MVQNHQFDRLQKAHVIDSFDAARLASMYMAHKDAHRGHALRSAAARRTLHEMIAKYAAPTDKQREEVDYARTEVQQLCKSGLHISIWMAELLQTSNLGPQGQRPEIPT
eukprot:COSAG03_NODE_970_length_5151_cov_637.110451_4_plen_109_part_00